ncbi:MAG: hypothetical protein ACOY93_11580 [Bacillota bacterium]
MSANQPPSVAAHRQGFWHGLVALILGLIAVPTLYFGAAALLGGYLGLFLMAGAVAFVGLFAGIWAAIANNRAGKIMGGIGALLCAGVVVVVLFVR